MIFVSSCPFRVISHYKVLLTDQMMNHSCPDGCGLFQADPAPGAQGRLFRKKEKKDNLLNK